MQSVLRQCFLEKEQKGLPTGRHQYTSIFHGVVCFGEFFISGSLGAESLIGVGAQRGIACCLLLRLHRKADGMSLCTDLGVGLNTSFWQSQTQTRQSTCSPMGTPLNSGSSGKGMWSLGRPAESTANQAAGIDLLAWTEPLTTTLLRVPPTPQLHSL